MTEAARIVSAIELYGTAACHLCDQAIAILDHIGCTFIFIDIAGNDEFDRYALRIPVLRRVDNGEELGWPLDMFAVLEFIS